MNANKQDAGGLPELPEPVGHVHSDYEYCAERPFKNDGWPVSVYEAHQVRAYAELCRAAPAGGDVEVVRLRQLLAASQEQVRILSDMVERGQAHHERMMKLMDSAPAGSVEVEELATRIDREVRAWESWREEDPDEYPITTVDLLTKAAALLRKLQQGAEYETPSIECYSYDGDQWFDAPDDVELVAGRRTGDTFELMVSHYSIQRKYVVKKAPDSFGDDYEVEPVRAASQGQDGGKA